MNSELPLPTLYHSPAERSLHSQTSPSLGTPQAQRRKGLVQWPPPHHSNPGSPRISAYLWTLMFWTLSGSTSIPEPPTRSTSFQASHPSSPRQLYQNQLRVCADLFLIAGAWFTLAPPPILIPLFGESLTSGPWMSAKTAFSPGLGQGPGPPHPAISQRGPERSAYKPRSHGICPQRLGSSYLLGTTVHHPPPQERRYAEA